MINFKKMGCSPSAERAPVIAAIYKDFCTSEDGVLPPQDHRMLKTALEITQCLGEKWKFYRGDHLPQEIAHRIFPDNEQITTHHHPLIRF